VNMQKAPCSEYFMAMSNETVLSPPNRKAFGQNVASSYAP
jgi:hypothetical protein